MVTRVLVVNPTATQNLGVVGSALEGLGCEIDHVAPAEAAASITADWPQADGVRFLGRDDRVADKLLPNYDGLIILGGAFSVRTDPPQTGLAPASVITDIEVLIRSAHAGGKPVLGICLGSQLIARAFGARVYKLPADEAHTAYPVGAARSSSAPTGQEYGFLSQHLTEAGWADPILGPSLRRSGATVFQEWHEDTFELPHGAALLGTRNVGATNQCFRIGPSTYGFQYHIEVGESLAQKWHSAWCKMWSLPKEEERALSQELLRQVTSGAIRKSEVFVAEFVQRWLGSVRLDEGARL
jgi:GMP synthase-like glutamine amidotransferase